MATEPKNLPAVVESTKSGTSDLPDPYSFDFHDRSTKLEPEHFELARQVLAAGGSKHMLADMCGIAYRTLRDWVRKGEENLEAASGIEDLDRWGAFIRYYRAGLVEFEAEQVSKVRNPEWLLERRMPERWGKKTQSDVNISRSEPQYERADPSKEDKEFLQRLAGGGVVESESEASSGDATPGE